MTKAGITNNIKELEEEFIEKEKKIGEEPNLQVLVEEPNDDIDILQDKEELKYFNEYGGFTADGKEYWIKGKKENRLPTVWTHIMANEKFGTIVTENMGGIAGIKIVD